MSTIRWTRPAVVRRCMAVLCAAGLCINTAVAAEPNPSWTALPAETAVIARIPNGAQFFNALREQTRFGAVLFDPQRWQKITDLWATDSDSDWEELTEALKKYNLKMSDAASLFHGEAGYALVVEPRPDREPLMIGLAWLEPEGDLAERIEQVLQQVVEEQEDGEHVVRRIDLELAGHDCMHLLIPSVAVDFSFDDDDEPFDEDITPEDIQRRQAELAEAMQNAKSVQTDLVNVFVTRLGGRLLVANTFAQSADKVAALREDDKQPTSEDFLEMSGAEQATAVFARFLSDHEGGGGGSDLAETPGMQESLPGGLTFMELFADPRPLLKLAEASDDPQAMEMLKALGLDTVGPFGYRSTLDGQLSRSGYFLSTPAPRRGLMALLDQPPTPNEPPAWVPASVTEFQQISFDLGKAFVQIRQLVLAQLGEQGQIGFDTIETQMQSLLKTDVASFLSSLGQRHSAVSFAPKRLDAPTVDEDGDPVEVGFSERTGIVWELQDEQVWQRVIQLGAGIAAAPGDGIEGVREQGFNGLRMDQEGISGGVFVGRGYLVLGIGEGVAQSLLASLRTPPSGDAALASSSLLRRARQLMPAEPCLAYSVGDSSGAAVTAKQSFLAALSAPMQLQQQLRLTGAIPADQPDATAAMQPFLEKLSSLLPEDSELEGVLGVSASQTLMTSRGMVYRSVQELPSP